MDNYLKLVERIAGSSGLTSDEIERKIEAKRAKLSGLISKEGAAQIIAAELGISFDNEKLKLSELVEGMKRARVVGQITQIFPVREFSKNGRSGKVANLLLGDDSTNVRIVLWDTHHIELVEQEKLKVGDVVEISNAGVRNGELHLGAFSDIKNSAEKISGVKTTRPMLNGMVKDAKVGNNLQVRAFIVHMFDPKPFETKDGEKRALFNFVLDDGSETIRGVVGSNVLSTLGMPHEDVISIENFPKHKEELLGEEMMFSGSCRMNTYFNKLEMSIEKIEKININSLIKELEIKQ